MRKTLRFELNAKLSDWFSTAHGYAAPLRRSRYLVCCTFRRCHYDRCGCGSALFLAKAAGIPWWCFPREDRLTSTDKRLRQINLVWRNKWQAVLETQIKGESYARPKYLQRAIAGSQG